MAQALPVYAVAAILLVASAGPVTREVRDASLGDFEALDDPRPLDSFPFLKQVRPYLPPVVIEWLIVEQSLNLPDGGDFRVDDNGRVLVVWPDGCEESHTSYLAGSTCDADPCNDPEPDPSLCGDPCLLPEDDPARPDACDPDQPPIQCPDGQIPGRNETTNEPECIPDPKCEFYEGHPDRPSTCPPPEPTPPPPPPPCPHGQPRDYKGNCIAIETKQLRSFSETSRARTEDFRVELTVPYANLSLVVQWDGLPVPDFRINVHRTTTSGDTDICWTQDGTSGDEICRIEDPGAIDTDEERRYTDRVSGPIPAGNYTLSVDYTPSQGPNSGLVVRLYGKPFDAQTNE